MEEEKRRKKMASDYLLSYKKEKSQRKYNDNSSPSKQVSRESTSAIQLKMQRSYSDINMHSASKSILQRQKQTKQKRSFNGEGGGGGGGGESSSGYGRRGGGEASLYPIVGSFSPTTGKSSSKQQSQQFDQQHPLHFQLKRLVNP